MNNSDFQFDKVSKKIIEELQEDARISNLDLAEKVHLSPSACLKRTKKLEEQGYIRHYTTDLDLSCVCAHIMAIAYIELSENQGMKANISFEREIKKLPQAVESYKVTGHTDYVTHFICKDIEEFNAIVEKLLANDIGIAKIKSDIVLSIPKPFEGYPLNELNWLNEK